MSKVKNKDMPFWAHIYELRNRILKILIAVFILSIISYILFPFYFKAFANIIRENLYATHIAEGFVTKIKISIFIGFFLTLPFLLFELLLFIFPALTKKEKLFFLSSMLAVFVLFICGLLFAFIYILPVSINFLKSASFYPANVNRLISYQTFINFFFQFLIGFGLSFQFPVILLLLLNFNLIKLRQLMKYFKYVIIICFIISAIITPPDVASQVLMAIPMIILYILTIIIAKIFKLGE